MRNNFPYINVYGKKTEKSKIVTQLLYGDTFKKIKKYGQWLKIKNDQDSYVGFIKNKKFLKNHKNTHKICNLFAKLYYKPSLGYCSKKKLSYGSKIKVLKKKGNFYNFDSFWIHKKDVKKIHFIQKNTFSDVKKFVNVKYIWGGKNFNGLDCSALVQILLNYNNKFCPRDTKDQIKYFKRKIKLVDVKKNDLIFWKGHVAIVISKKKLIHAYGPLKKVVIMDINKTIKRINKTAKLDVVDIKRIK